MKVTNDPWYQAVESDLRLLMPGCRLEVGTASFGDFVFCNGWWCDDGWWYGAQPWSLPVDTIGRRHRTLLRHGESMNEAHA
eukprot:268524-Karenia_brevis.AAC.1